MNSTIKKFGYSENLIKEYDYWVVLYRPQQVTIGSLLLICKENKFHCKSQISSHLHVILHFKPFFAEKVQKWGKSHIFGFISEKSQ